MGHFGPTTSHLVPTMSYFMPITCQLVPTMRHLVPTMSHFDPTTSHLVPTESSSADYVISPIAFSETDSPACANNKFIPRDTFTVRKILSLHLKP